MYVLVLTLVYVGVCTHRDAKDRLSPGCQKQVFKIQMDAAEDYRADAEL